MWRLKVGESGNDPYIYSVNNFVGRQIWEFDPNAGTPEERAEVERVRYNFTKNRRKGFPSADLFWRLQVTPSFKLLRIPMFTFLWFQFDNFSFRK